MPTFLTFVTLAFFCHQSTQKDEIILRKIIFYFLVIMHQEFFQAIFHIFELLIFKIRLLFQTLEICDVTLYYLYSLVFRSLPSIEKE